MRLVVGHVFHLLGSRVIHPDVVGHTALVVFPGAELAHHAVVGHLFAVGRVAAEATLGKRNGLRESSLFMNGIKSAVEACADAVAVNDGLSVGGPGHHDVVGTHAVAQVVAAVCRGIGHAQRLTARRRNGINLGVAVVLAREGDRLPVG